MLQPAARSPVDRATLSGVRIFFDDDIANEHITRVAGKRKHGRRNLDLVLVGVVRKIDFSRTKIDIEPTYVNCFFGQNWNQRAIVDKDAFRHVAGLMPGRAFAMFSTLAHVCLRNPILALAREVG